MDELTPLPQPTEAGAIIIPISQLSKLRSTQAAPVPALDPSVHLRCRAPAVSFPVRRPTPDWLLSRSSSPRTPIAHSHTLRPIRDNFAFLFLRSEHKVHSLKCTFRSSLSPEGPTSPRMPPEVSLKSGHADLSPLSSCFRICQLGTWQLVLLNTPPFESHGCGSSDPGQEECPAGGGSPFSRQGHGISGHVHKWTLGGWVGETP